MSELLGGEREDAAVVPAAVEDVVLDTVAYAETARRRNGGWRFWTFVAFTACASSLFWRCSSSICPPIETLT